MTDLILLVLAFAASSEPDDRALAAAIAGGDHAAFKLFFDRNHLELARYLQRRGLSEAETADILQQAFLTIWEKRAGINPELPLRGYLFRIGLSRAYNRFRDTAKFVWDATDFELVAGKDTDATTRRELLQALHTAIGSLPEKRRQVFELCYLQEMSYREVAAALEVSIKTVENHMTLALKDLREKLKNWV